VLSWSWATSSDLVLTPAGKNLSRPYLVGLVDRGEIPSRKVGSRRRVRLADVLLYREIDQARRLGAVRDLAAEAQELGLY